MKWIGLKTLTLAASVFFAHQAQAWEDAPVDKNFPGPTLGLNLNFGQAQKAGGSSNPGPFWSAGFEAGYVFKRDTWNRMELGFELATGGLEFRDRDQIDGKVSIDLKTMAMVKAGYGYSLGGAAFGVWRLGVGMAFAEMDTNIGPRDDGSAVTASLGWDAVFPASDRLHMIVGFNFRYFNFNWDNADSFQVNVPAIYGALRLQL